MEEWLCQGRWRLRGYDDNNSVSDDHRDIYYYYIEALQHLTPKLYGVTRLSQIRAPGGYLIEGDTATLGLPTSDLWRLSLGLGYQSQQPSGIESGIPV